MKRLLLFLILSASVYSAPIKLSLNVAQNLNNATVNLAATKNADGTYTLTTVGSGTSSIKLSPSIALDANNAPVKLSGVMNGDGTFSLATSGGGAGGGAWGSITGTLSSQTDLQNALNLKANSSSLGTAATLNVGTGANQIVQLDGSGKLPAINGSQLTNLPSGSPGGSNLNLLYNNAGSSGGITSVNTDGSAAINLDAGIGGTSSFLRFRRGQTGFGDFSHVLQPLRPISAGNPNDAGRTVTDAITATSSAIVKSATAWFNLGDINRTISESGNTHIPAATTISALVQTTIAVASNGAPSSSSTIHAVSTANFPTSAGLMVFTVLASDGYHNITYTGISGNDFTGCTGGTAGTLATGNLIYSTTAATMSANGTTGTSVTAAISGRSDDPYSWGYNVASDSAYVPTDSYLQYTIEPTYTTGANGTRQIEHYLTVKSEDGTLKRIFNVTAIQYALNTHLPSNTATMQLYPDNLIVGVPGSGNDWLQFTNTATSGLMALTGNSTIAYNGSNQTFLTAQGGNVLGWDTAGNATGHLFSGAATASLFESFGTAGQVMEIDVGAQNRKRGLRWNNSPARWEYQDDNANWNPFNPYGNANNTNTSAISAVTLTNTAGDFAQLGYVTSTSYNSFVEITLSSSGGNYISQKYALPFTNLTNRDGSGLTFNVWYECLPLSIATGDGENVALDCLPRPFSNPKNLTFRVRRKAAGSASLSIAGDIKITSGSGETWVTSPSTGSGATVQGMLLNNGPSLNVSGPTNRVTAQSAANSSIASFTVGGADSSLEVSMNMNVTAATAISTSMNCTYTDESNTSRTMIFPTTSLSGSFLAGGLVTGTGAFETPVLHIRCKAGTTITLLTASGTFTGVTYTAEGIIKQNR